MSESREKRSVGVWGSATIGPGEARDLDLTIGESYSSMTAKIPLHVRRGRKPGPTVFITAAIHGDEINGTGIIRSLIRDVDLHLEAGALILVPVLNILGFEHHSRYLPDRRDLNRCFPGSASGSMASRMARLIFDEIIGRSDYGIDLHTAALRRTNFPNVRADTTDKKVRRFAQLFGAELIVSGAGPLGAFRREACGVGCPTVVAEGGEVWKVEPSIVAWALRGIRNVLIGLKMVRGQPVRPALELVIEHTAWVRAERGGFLQYHVRPGSLVRKGTRLVTNTNLLGVEHNALHAPFDGVVIGLTTLPAVSTGEPVCHLAQLPRNAMRLRAVRQGLEAGTVHAGLSDDLSTSVAVVAGPAGKEPERG